MDQRFQLDPKLMVRCHRDPVYFSQRFIMQFSSADIKADLPGKRLEPESIEILNAIAKHDYVSGHAGRGITKTFTLSHAVIWWLFTRPNSRVCATGPKYDQLKITLWAEIRKWLHRGPLKQFLSWSSEKIVHNDPRMDAFGQILTAKDKENLSGIHADHVLWIVDEASNVEDEIIDTITGGMNDPENKIVLMGNPTRTNGAFYNSFTKEKDVWHILHFNSENCSRVNKKWLKRMERFPRESDSYRVWVLGLPPTGNPQAIISLEDCEKARSREIKTTFKDVVEFGVDPAWEGNDLTTIGWRWGKKYMGTKTYARTTSQQEYRYLLDEVRKARKLTKYTGKIRVKVDKGGGFGKGLIEFVTLNEKDNLECVPVNFGGEGTEEYRDYGTFLWYYLADIIGEIELNNDDELIEELSSREWRPTDRGKVKCESKSDYKKRLGRSPDRADSCILAYAPGVKKIFQRKIESEPEIREFEVDWTLDKVMNKDFFGPHMIEVAHYAALALNEDLSINGLAAIYEFIRDQLWIYGEFYQELPDAEALTPKVKAKIQARRFKDSREAIIMGDEMMFKARGSARPFAEVARRAGLYMREPFKYNEYGAIALGTQMYQTNKIKIHPLLRRSRIQISLQSIKSPEENTGYYRSLLLILSEVKRLIKEKPRDKLGRYRSPFSGKYGDYQPVAVKPKETDKSTVWMSR